MFTKELLIRNRKLIDFVNKIHESNLIEPNTYVIDLDTVYENAKLLKKTADDSNITLFQMTKQFGRNPLVANEVKKAGITHAVAVDWKEAEVLFNSGINIGNIGHVVQVPKNKISKILDYKPMVWTIYSLENLVDLNHFAEKKKIVQNVILRVYDSDVKFYPSQSGGIHVNNLEEFLEKAKKLKNISIIGATSFPALLMNNETDKVEPTKNLNAILKAKRILIKMGYKPSHINIPSANSVKSIPLISKLEGTFGEPGHALTGTTPITSTYKNIESPAMVYYSQVSHKFEDKIIAFAGGHYRRGRMKGALIGKDLNYFENIPLPNDALDYYFEFKKNNNEVKTGDIVLTLFRAQIFTTRSSVMVVKGLKSNNPKIIGLFDSQGKTIEK